MEKQKVFMRRYTVSNAFVKKAEIADYPDEKRKNLKETLRKQNKKHSSV